MRFAVLLAAMAALGVQPAKAAELFAFNISGSMFSTVVTCLSPGRCIPSTGARTFDLIVQAYLPEPGGSSGFSYGSLPVGLYTGNIVRLSDGGFIGQTLTFSLNNNMPVGCSPGLNCNGQEGFGTASTFAVSSLGPVPEPATWSMMILGFGAIGVAMRRRQPELAISAPS